MLITQGTVLFFAGLGGTALSLIAGLVAAVAMRSSGKKLRKRLDEVYKA